VKPGETVVVYGCGPVGLMAAYSAMVKGAAQVYSVDRHPDRLKLAKSIGAIPIDDSKDDPVEAVMELTHGLGADRGCECVGWQAHDPQGHEHPNMTLNKLFKSVRATGGLGVVGVFTQDPKSPDPLLKEGEIALEYPVYFEKGLTMGSGQADVKRYNRYLRDLIHDDRAAPSFLVSHELPLDQAPEAYKHFDARDNGWTKVVLHPGAAAKRKPRARRAGYATAGEESEAVATPS
jgi:glutathione-independent formaldehyde dehydrogenase